MSCCGCCAMSDFEGFLIERNDKLEQTAHELLWHMTHPNAEPSEANGDYKLYDMAQIGPLLDAAEEVLENAGINTCRPYYVENEVPCYLSGTCSFTPCPMCKSQ